MKRRLSIRKIHKLLSLIVFVQLLMWMVSGLYMTVVLIDKVRGNHLVEREQPKALEQVEYFSVSTIAARYQEAVSISLSHRLEMPAYHVQSHEQSWWINALTGEPIQ